MKKRSLQVFLDIIDKMDGKVISHSDDEQWFNIECSAGHLWTSHRNYLIVGSWCRKCFAISRRLSIKHAQEIAAKRGGDCLSETYENAHAKLLWKCSVGHIWPAALYSIKNGRWCPQCRIGLSEKCCRFLLETIFEQPFPKAKPEWLKNEEGQKLELDGYCEALGIAFEHNGDQHFKEVKKFKQSLERIKVHDEIKLRACKTNGVKLIVVPALFSKLRINQLQTFVYDELCRLEISIPVKYETVVFKLEDVYEWDGRKSSNDKMLKELKQLAIDRNGSLLSNEYKHWALKLEWQCNVCDKQWNALPSSIKQGSWCPRCAEQQRSIPRKKKL